MKVTEQADGPTSHYIKNDMSVPVYPIEFLYTSIYPLQRKLYEVLQKHCNLHFFSKENLIQLEYSSNCRLVSFAVSSKNEYFVTIGGMGDTANDDFPVGVISKSKCFVLAANVKDFLMIMVYYPFWNELIGCSNSDINDIVESYLKDIAFQHNQKYLLQYFNFNTSSDILTKLLDRIAMPQFISLFK